MFVGVPKSARSNAFILLEVEKNILNFVMISVVHDCNTNLYGLYFDFIYYVEDKYPNPKFIKIFAVIVML